MSDFGRDVHWQANERLGDALAMERNKHPVSSYRVECRWWSAHLAYGERLPGADAGTWLDTVEAWSLCVSRLGYEEAIFEVNRLRKEAGR